MNTAVEDISSTKKRLKIEIPTDIIEKEYKMGLDNVRKRAKIPGFRPGNAPVTMIEKKFGNDIKSDIIDRLVPEYYSKALKEADLVPVTLPKFESSLDIKRNEPLSFSLTVEVRPMIPDLNYIGLKVDDIAVEAEAKEIDETINGLQDERAMFEVVDREIRENDLIIIDFLKLDPTGQKELSSGKDQVMNLGTNIAPQGILDEIVGRKKGDTVEITLPDFGQDQSQEASKKGNRIRITVKEVKEKILHAIDDEFAKDFGHESLESLREGVREGILKAKQDSAAKQQKQQLLDMMVGSHEFDVPESMLERELEQLVINEKYSARQSKDSMSNEVAGKDSGVDISELSERLKPKALSNAKAAIILEMIADKESINVSEEEVKSKVSLLARHLQTTPDAVINLFVTRDGSLENFKKTIRDEKALDLILAKAEITKGE